MDKILFVISYLDKGGSERALSNITQHFPENYELEILVNSDKVIDYPYNAKIISMGMDEKPKTSSVLFQFRVLLKRIKWLKKLKKTGQYKACISFLDSANVANILSGNKKCKTIISVRNSLKKQALLPQYKYVVNPLVKALYNKAHKVVACSGGVEKELKEIFKVKADKVVTIENGYDIADILKKSEEPLDEDILQKLEGKKKVITVGRMTGQKGQWHLIRAFANVVQRVPEAVLIIAGTGELEGYQKQLATACGIKDNVIFTGYINNPFKYENNSDLFILPSLFEGFPNALAEAVCVGLPCVACDFETGAREILAPLLETDKVTEPVKTEYGYIIPVCSGNRYEKNEELEAAEKCMADTLVNILSDDLLLARMRQESLERAGGLGIDNCVAKWVEVINQ